jgi:hypothetical protein
MGREGAITAIVAGFLIGALPLGLSFAVSQPPDFSSPGGGPTSILGVRTTARWLGILQTAGAFGICGAIGALSAWFSWNVTKRSVWIGAGAVSILVAVLLATPFLTLLFLTMDRSCHNPMRDGTTFVASELDAQIPLGSEDLPALVQVFEEFATTSGLSFRSDGDRHSASTISLSVCNDAGTQIVARSLTARDVAINVYQPRGGSSWEEPSERLLLAIERRWPDRLVFMNDRGERITAPSFLGRHDPPPAQREPPG